MYSENLEEFCELPVVEFESADDWQGPEVAYRVRADYDVKDGLSDRLKVLAMQPGVDQLQALVIGTWNDISDGFGAEAGGATLLSLASQLPALRGLFLGDITYEECEISWINQTDVSPFLQAYPAMQVLVVRGGEGLSFSQISHRELRSLRIETGGLPRSVVREIFLCDFPALESLQLLFGDENYGFDGSVEDLQPLLSGSLYPKLKYLGLMNSTISNDIAAVVVNSPIIDRIETLDLSMGTLDDSGVASLKSLAGKANLKTLDISHHYASAEAIDELRAALSCEVIADDPQEADGDWRPVLHAE